MKKHRSRRLAIGLLLNLFISLSALAADRINITAPPYNAVPNDGISDNTAINNAIAAGGSIYFPPGTYNYSGPMYLTANQSFRLYGDGPGVSTIIFTGPNAGIYGYSMGTKSLAIDGLTLQANTTKCGTAIQAVFNDPSANKKFHSATIHNVKIRGSDTDGVSGGYWTGGIGLYQAQNSVISNVEITGNARENAGCPAPQASATGILWDSSSYTASGLQMKNIQVRYFDAALRTTGYVENLFLTGFEFPFCGNNGNPAVDLNSSDPTNLRSTFHLMNGHVASLQHGIRLTNLRDVKISKVTYAHATGRTTPDNPNTECGSSGNDLALSNVKDAVISQCSFIGTGPEVADEAGIRLDNAHFVQILGNYFTHYYSANSFGSPPANPQDACINVQPTSSVVRIVNTVFETVGGIGGVNIPYYNAAGDTYFRGNNR